MVNIKCWNLKQKKKIKTVKELFHFLFLSEECNLCNLYSWRIKVLYFQFFIIIDKDYNQSCILQNIPQSAMGRKKFWDKIQKGRNTQKNLNKFYFIKLRFKFDVQPFIFTHLLMTINFNSTQLQSKGNFNHFFFYYINFQFIGENFISLNNRGNDIANLTLFASVFP